MALNGHVDYDSAVLAVYINAIIYDVNIHIDTQPPNTPSFEVEESLTSD